MTSNSQQTSFRPQWDKVVAELKLKFHPSKPWYRLYGLYNPNDNRNDNRYVVTSYSQDGFVTTELFSSKYLNYVRTGPAFRITESGRKMYLTGPAPRLHQVYSKKQWIHPRERIGTSKYQQVTKWWKDDYGEKS